MNTVVIDSQSGTFFDAAGAYVLDPDNLTPEQKETLTEILDYGSNGDIAELAKEFGKPVGLTFLNEQQLSEIVDKIVSNKIRLHEVKVGWISGLIGLAFVFGIVHSIWLLKVTVVPTVG